MKSTFAVIAGDYAQAVFAFNCDATESFAQFLSEGFLAVAELLSGGAAAVVTERAVDHRCEA